MNSPGWIFVWNQYYTLQADMLHNVHGCTFSGFSLCMIDGSAGWVWLNASKPTDAWHRSSASRLCLAETTAIIHTVSQGTARQERADVRTLVATVPSPIWNRQTEAPAHAHRIRHWVMGKVHQNHGTAPPPRRSACLPTVFFGTCTPNTTLGHGQGCALTCDEGFVIDGHQPKCGE
jgi:hypothetical protein